MFVVIAMITTYMVYNANKVQLSYELAKMLPSSDPAYVEYETFKQRFGEDGNVFAIGIKNDKIFELNHFNDLYDLCYNIKKYDGIEEVVSITRVLNIYKNDSLRKFEFKQVISKKPTTQKEVDSIHKIISSLAFYEGLLYNPKTNCYLIGITLDKKKLNDRSRVDLVMKIKKDVENYKTKDNIEVHYSGLPYIRTVTSQKVESELKLFVILSLIIAALIMIIFFRSMYVLLSSLIVVMISIAFTLGLVHLMGYKITILTGVIPSLLVIIAIENCIYILNKYHWEIKNHGNKFMALSRVVQRIGFATLITNATTATGFATFIFTNNAILKEFGVVSSVSIMVEYFISITLIPIIFSFLPIPNTKQILHLESKFVKTIISKITFIITNKRKIVYSLAISIMVFCIYGMTLIKTSGKVVDDIPVKDPIYVDLKFFETNFKGVMPFEISIDTKKKNGVMKLSTINKIDQLQNEILKFNIFSKPLSLAEMVKFSKQAYYNGNREMYQMPDNNEKNFILQYFPSKISGKKNVMHSFIDSTKQFTRISFQMEDVGTNEMNIITKNLKPKIDSIFDPKLYNVTITGNSLVFTKGTEFLINNLIESVFIGILLISILMAIVFSSFRMIIIAIVVNLIPLLVTAGIMGFGNIPIKPTTLIVFSIALGISIDNAIFFLTKYRHEIKRKKCEINQAVYNALNETGISIVYTSIVLVLGFAIYMVSGFGGTQALGMLISVTLFVALFFNIIVLPSLILSFNKHVVTKAFKEPLIEIYDLDEDEEDIETKN